MGKHSEHTSHKKPRDEIIPPKKNKFVLFIKAVYRRFYNFAIIVIRALLDFFLSHKAKSMPPISDPILLESATSLAQKIRTQKVS